MGAIQRDELDARKASGFRLGTKNVQALAPGVAVHGEVLGIPPQVDDTRREDDILAGFRVQTRVLQHSQDVSLMLVPCLTVSEERLVGLPHATERPRAARQVGEDALREVVRQMVQRREDRVVVVGRHSFFGRWRRPVEMLSWSCQIGDGRHCLFWSCRYR